LVNGRETNCRWDPSRSGRAAILVVFDGAHMERSVGDVHIDVLGCDAGQCHVNAPAVIRADDIRRGKHAARRAKRTSTTPGVTRKRAGEGPEFIEWAPQHEVGQHTLCPPFIASMTDISHPLMINERSNN
jgi:hypothetical protein